MRTTLLTLLIAASCRQTATPEPTNNTPQEERPRPLADPPAAVIRPRGQPPQVIHLEVVRTEAARNRGLMFRREMAEDHGMIFVFPRPDHNVFWMHNTILPLDMIFIRPDRTILGIVKNATPETDDPREVPGESLWVLEVNGGYADRHHLAAGDPVEMLGVGPALE